MITKEVDGKPRWLFAESFQLLLELQSYNGSWDASDSTLDGILSAMAALLAMLKHITQPGEAYDIEGPP
jgi:hypothetical protein